MNQIDNMLNPDPASIPYKKWEKQFTSDHTKDFILPDTVDDAKRVLCFDIMLRPDETYISAGGKIEYSGEIVCSALLLTDSGELVGTEFSFDYSGSASIPEDIAEDEKSAVNVDISVQSAALRLSNPRKINAKLRLAANAEVYSEAHAAPEISVSENGRRSDSASASDSVCCDEITIRAAKKDKIRTGRAVISEDIELDRSFPEIGRIIYQTASFTPGSVRIEDSGASVEGELTYTCIYTHESEPAEGEEASAREYITVVKRFPITENVSANSVSEGTIAYLTAESLTADTAENASGERRIIELDVTAGIELESSANIECNITKDVFSTLCECRSSMRHIDVSELMSNPRSEDGVFSSSFGVSGKISAPDAEKITASFAKLNELSLRRDENKLNAVGKLNIVCLTENSGSYNSVESTLPFSIALDLPVPDTEGVEASVSTGISSLNCHLSDGNIEADAEISFRALISGITGEELVYEVALDMSHPHEGKRAPVTVFYPEPDTRIFDIAKRYKVSPAAIEQNGNIAVIV